MYAIVDIETTGGHASGNGITEIAIFIHDGSRILKQFSSLVNPGQNIPQHITALTGISNAMVASAPVFEELAEEIHSMLRDQIFVAHNVNFDHSFVKHQLKQSDFDLNVKKLCTVRLGRKIFPGLPSYSLGNLCRSVGIDVENRHRAEGDARATVELFEKMMLAGGQQQIDLMLKKTSSEQWLPILLEKSVIEALPSKPGVYYFHDIKGKVMYVGKAINIKKRVTSHFTHDDLEKRRQYFLRSIANISFKECASELHALVLESAEIKKLWPKYNYSQKQPAQKYGLYSFEDSRGYIRLAIDKKKKNLRALYHFNMLNEGISLLRKMAESFELDMKLCHLDRSPIDESDIAFLESPLHYNGKIKMALDALEQKLPTFAIIDQGISASEKLCMLVVRGSFWGMGYIRSDEDIKDIYSLKEMLQPYADNDFIRNSIYSYAEANPSKKILLQL